jgi:F0F1-type ATP synthase alpha subunit
MQQEKNINVNKKITQLKTKTSNLYQGIVIKVKDGIATIKGLDNVKSGEVLVFASGAKGLALNLSHNEINSVIFGNERLIKEGVKVKNTGKLMKIGISSALLGRVIN